MKNTIKKITSKQIIGAAVIVFLIAIAVIGGIYYNQSVDISSSNIQTPPTTINKSELSYKGKDGTTALALLQHTATIKMTGSGEMAYVTSINGTAANPKNQYWQLFINGKSSMVGAGSLVTKNSDTITWKLSSF